LRHIDKVAQQEKEDFELHLVGEGPLGDVLKNYATTLSMHDRIFWHGWCGKNELRQYYQQAICILNPSLYEGMPNVVLEAMACGLPAIASNVAGNKSVVRHDETGFLFNLQSPEQFRKAVAIILKDSNLSLQMGLRGRDWVKRDFSWDKVAENYMRLFEDK
jgi:glycosyltransferase involved in cell wall biosynthesis